MATTVAQHSVATFTSPVNGTTPIDANTVRGNDNTIRTSYNDHDSDPGIHVQSSTLASRPAAGTAGRKWITEDSGVYTLWFDDGTNWHPVSSENIALTVLAGETLAKGDVVKVTGWNNGQDLPEVVKTTSASDTAFAVITAAVSSGSMGYATNTGIVQDVNTAAYSVGTILYANGSGGFTSTKPTSGNYQPVAYVLRANASNGVYYVEFSTPRIVERSDNVASTVVLRDASGDFSAGTITATAVNATTLDLTNLEVTNIKAKDGTQAIAIADTTGKLTISDGVLLSALTASQAVFTDASKNLVSNAITGTGNVVMSASPTLSGTISAANLSLSGTLGVTSTVTFTTPLADSNLATISTAGKVSNSATTATNLNTASAIVARDASGNFTAGTITATLSGTATNANNLTGTTNQIRSVSYTFPASQGGASTVLTNDGSGNLSWASGGSAAAGSLTGTTLASNVVSSSLTSVGTLSSLTVSGDLTVDTNTLKVNSTANRVGILNATPGSTFHIGSTVATGGLADSNWNANITAASNTQLCVQDGVVQGYFGAIGTFATPEFRLATYTNHPLRFLVNNTNVGSFINNTGSFILNGSTPRLGINSATPGSTLHINSTVASGGLADNNFVANITSASNTILAVQDGTVQTYLQSAGTVPESRLVSYTNHALAFGTNNVMRWRINTSGHLLAETDATYDIGASGATRPRDIFLSRNATISGTAVVAGNLAAGTVTPNANVRLQVDGPGTTGSPTLRINTSTAASFIHSQENYAASQASTQTNVLLVGREGANNNSAYMGFYYDSSGSTNNYLSLGHFGAVHLVKIYPNNRVETAGTISVGGATPSTSGAGITFPATQSASSDANTLDDYEEGTWTPTPTGWTGLTYAQQSGNYTKIGNQVTAWFFLQFTGTSAATAVKVQGLPFSANTNTRGGAITYYDVAVDTNGILLNVQTTEIVLYADATTAASVNSNGNVTSKYLVGSVTYRV